MATRPRLIQKTSAVSRFLVHVANVYAIGFPLSVGLLGLCGRCCPCSNNPWWACSNAAYRRSN